MTATLGLARHRVTVEAQDGLWRSKETPMRRDELLARIAIGVLRPFGRPTLGSLTMLTSQLRSALTRESIHGRRSIVEPGRVRIPQSAEEKE